MSIKKKLGQLLSLLPASFCIILQSLSSSGKAKRSKYFFDICFLFYLYVYHVTFDYFVFFGFFDRDYYSKGVSYSPYLCLDPHVLLAVKFYILYYLSLGYLPDARLTYFTII